jgi:hypothetical protein
VSLPTNDKKFNVTNGLSVGASGFEVINTSGEWVGASGPGESPYGATGSQGYTGDDGATGIDGASGITGDDGVQGVNGSVGYDGATGPSADILTTGNPRGLWDANTTYYPGDIVVTIPADSHRCLVENTGRYPDSNQEYWILTAWAGASGASGIDGSLGVTGDDGVAGDQGTQGVQGPDGAQGQTGETGATGGFGGYRAGTWAFDPTYTGNLVDLSNGNNTAVDNNEGFANALGTIPLNYSSGNYYYMFSIHVDGVSDNGSFIGVANQSADFNNPNYFLGSDTNSAGFAFNGDYWYGGNIQSGLPTWGTGDIVDIAVDQDDSFIWIRVNGGNWNNDPTANPGNYTGKLFNYVSGNYYPAISIYGVSGPSQFTIREYAEYTVPTGYANYTFLPASVQAIQGYTGATGVTGETGATGSNGARYHTNSNTTLSLTTGATGVVVVDENLNYSAGQTILLADGGGKHIHATVDSYDAGTKILAFTPIDHVGTGSSSPWEINLDGAEGQQGATGVTGDDGAQGIDGERGYQGSSFGTEGATGADGATGTVGHDGATGIAGATGSQGSQGGVGEQGVQGNNGAQGVRGVTGDQGDQGIDGDQGTQGADGATGPTGATGAQGTDGSYSLVDWDTNFGHYGANQTIDNSLGAVLDSGGPTVVGNFSAGKESIIVQQTARIGSGGVDKAMFSIFQTGDTGGKTGYIGIADEAFYNQSYIGSDDHSFGFDNAGDVWFNGSIVDTGTPTFSTGDRIDVAIHWVTSQYWVRKNGGSWNGDPAAGTGGKVFVPPTQGHVTPAVTTDGYQGFAIQYTSTYSVPSGFTFLGGSLATNVGSMGPDGATGATGPDGNQGFDGASGPTGLDGATGYSAATGVTGDQGTIGQDGATGADGNDGNSGAMGPDGNDGNPGAQGDMGWQGLDGATGVKGSSGVTGDAGDYGATGSYGHRFRATLLNTGYQIGDTGTGEIDVQIDSQTGDYSYSFAAGQTIIIYKDVENYATALVNSYDNSTGAINATIQTTVGSSSGETLYVNLDGAVGIEGASGVTGQDGPQGPVGERGYTGGNGAAFVSFGVNTTVTGIMPAYLPPENMVIGSMQYVQGNFDYPIVAGMTVTYGGHTYTVSSSQDNGNEYSRIYFTDIVSGGEIPDGILITVEGYGPAENDGYQGATGATGVQGASGVTGDQGVTGDTGTDGASGPTGLDGATGVTGATGVQGIDGDMGYDGATGFSLAQGSTGLSGTSQQTVDLFAANEIGTAKYLIQGVDGSTNVQATEVILTQNGGGVYITEYATLRTGAKVMDVTATTNGSVISLKVTPQTSGTNFAWVRESVRGRIGGTTVEDNGPNLFYSFSHSDNGGIPIDRAYVYPSTYFINLINFTSLIGTSVTFDSAGIGPQNPAIGEVVSWDGATLIVTITSGNFTSRTDLDKITYGY